jgi:hypothetical protein
MGLREVVLEVGQSGPPPLVLLQTQDDVFASPVEQDADLQMLVKELMHLHHEGHLSIVQLCATVRS